MRVLYLDLDTLRPDHLGCYGYHRNTSPNIDRIASEGMRFDNFYTSDAPCLPSRAAMMSGRFGIHNGVINHGGTCADRPADGTMRSFRDSLATGGSFINILRDSKLHTCYIGGFGERHSAYWYYAGFHEIHDTAKGGMESAEDVTPTVLDWIDKNADCDNWYLHVNYWDPHTPYRAPEDFGNPFKDDPLPDWMTEETSAKHWQKAGPHSAQDIAMYDNSTSPAFPRHPGEAKGLDGFRTMIDGYDCGIRYMDGHIGQLLDALDKKGVLDDLVIMVSSDHGENMGELGIYGEHGTADNITCRIPMIIRWPGRVKAGTADEGLHYNTDICPTYADMLDRPKKDYWDGSSFAPALLEQKDCGHEQLIISQCCHVCQRSVRWDDYLYIRTYHDGFHLFDEEQVYNLKDDPFEQFNLAESKPELCREGAWRLMNWHDNMMSTMPSGRVTDPMRIVLDEGGPFHARGALKKYVERLKASGREDKIELLKARHPREFK
ncbi:MAG: sulfatase [Planctomycetes bacterium]|nr:sulfatase [Planctomycetota bacterium]